MSRGRDDDPDFLRRAERARMRVLAMRPAGVLVELGPVGMAMHDPRDVAALACALMRAGERSWGDGFLEALAAAMREQVPHLMADQDFDAGPADSC